MKRRLITAAFLMLIGALALPGSVSAREEEVEISPRQTAEAQRAARRFVARMQQTREVAALVNELFLPDFISHFVSGDCECLPPALYSQLSADERLRWFFALYNFSYLITLDVLHGPQRNPFDEKYNDSAFESLLPVDLAGKLRKLIPLENDFKFPDYRAFQNTLASLEKILGQTREHLMQRGLEQTPAFQKKLGDEVTGAGIGYRVRAYVGGENIKDCEPLVGFSADQLFYRVETPLMLGVILTQDGGKMKIVRLTIVDGD